MTSIRRRLVLLVAAVVAAAVAATLLVVLLTGGDDGAFGYDDPFDRFPHESRGGTGQEVQDAPSSRTELTRFLEFVSSDIQTFWSRRFERAGATYEPAVVTVFENQVRTGCGPATEQVGPFYCPVDQRVYLDLDFFRRLAVEFKAPGDFAQAYVIAHEIGHHVQTLTGVTAQVNEAMAEGVAPPNELSIRLELQADCLAGVWGHSTYERRMLERGDLDEGLRAAAAVGDDRIQKRTTGRINPETWTHGSSEQRRHWFLRGFDRGDPGACDTFSVAQV